MELGFKGERVLITGGTGFFGRWLLATIARAHRQFGIRATALTRNPQAFRAAYPALADHAAISLAHGDVRYFEFPKGRFSHVVHAATDTSVAADSDSATLIDTVVSGTARVPICVASEPCAASVRPKQMRVSPVNWPSISAFFWSSRP